MREVYQRVTRVASSPFTVLITGETGTGKELVAQALHHNDSTRKGPLVAVNCGAIPESLLESEFFGHERGAFTGADRVRKGRFEQAAGGTLLLDEIGTLPLAMQAKLLRVLQDGTFERVGGGEMIQADCRIVAATNEDLGRRGPRGAVSRGPVLPAQRRLDRPAASTRADRGPAAAGPTLPRGPARRGFPEKSVARERLARLARYDWPGNVRELEHVVEQMVVTTLGDEIGAEDVPPHLTTVRDEPFSLDFDPARPLQAITDELTERIERAYLARVLERYNGRIAPTADHCGLSRRSISEKLRRYGIDKADFKPHALGGRS